METTKYDRKPFTVNAVELTLDNVGEVAAWCKGTVEQVTAKVLGTTMKLPVVKIQGQGAAKSKTFVANLGHFIAEYNGSFRVYKPAVFREMFQKSRVPVYRGTSPLQAATEQYSTHPGGMTEPPQTVDLPDTSSLESSI
jgi:hypothetical protein